MENNEIKIELLEKANTETLHTKNAEFLAKYPTRDEQIDYYTKLAMNVFEEFEIDGSYTYDGVYANVEDWYDNKQGLINLFRKHPYWCEEAKAIVFAQNEIRAVNYSEARWALGNIIDYVRQKLDIYDEDALLVAIFNTLDHMVYNENEQTSTISEDFIQIFSDRYNVDELPKEVKRIFAVGTKITKFVQKCCKYCKTPSGEIVDATKFVDEHAEGDRNYQSFDKLYARFADYLSELAIKKITLVSLHFCDFMLMSNGNSWLSCHFINSHNIFHDDSDQSYSGCYKQGCLSYALDNPSFLLYTLPHTYEGDEYYRQKKLNRMCCQYDNGILVTGKCYPDNTDKLITRYRQTLQLIVSTLEDVPNLWTFTKNIRKIDALVSTDNQGMHYRDYENSSQKPTISICKHHGIDLDKTMIIGHKAYCVHCGESLAQWSDAKYLQCPSHRLKPICAHCGCVIRDHDDRAIIDDKMYCEDCYFYCDYHGEYEPITEGENHIETVDGREMDICNYGLTSFVRCDECGKWLSYAQRYVHNGHIYCRECYRTTALDRRDFRVEPCFEYQVGDYVLIADDVTCCTFNSNDDMETNYSGRIVRIERIGDHFGKTAYSISLIGDEGDWMWSDNCFVGKIVGDNLTDAIIGMHI